MRVRLAWFFKLKFIIIQECIIFLGNNWLAIFLETFISL